MILIGIDFGEKRIGVAVSDETGTFAFPREVIQNDENAVSKIATIVLENKVEKVVFGLSQNKEGKDNPVMLNGRKFVEDLKKVAGVEIVFQNESFSSFHAEIDFNKPTGAERTVPHSAHLDGSVDASAASIILQRYIDSHGNN
jgi:putative Holliday junction resolvase